MPDWPAVRAKIRPRAVSREVLADRQRDVGVPDGAKAGPEQTDAYHAECIVRWRRPCSPSTRHRFIIDGQGDSALG